jgi:ribosomal protein L44E
MVIRRGTSWLGKSWLGLARQGLELWQVQEWSGRMGLDRVWMEASMKFTLYCCNCPDKQFSQKTEATLFCSSCCKYTTHRLKFKVKKIPALASKLEIGNKAQTRRKAGIGKWGFPTNNNHQSKRKKGKKLDGRSQNTTRKNLIG